MTKNLSKWHFHHSVKNIISITNYFSTWMNNHIHTKLWGVNHYSDIIMGAMASQITSFRIVYSTVYSGADHTKPQISASLAFVGEIHQWPVDSPHKGPLNWKIFPFDYTIMHSCLNFSNNLVILKLLLKFSMSNYITQKTMDIITSYWGKYYASENKLKEFTSLFRLLLIINWWRGV